MNDMFVSLKMVSAFNSTTRPSAYMDTKLGNWKLDIWLSTLILVLIWRAFKILDVYELHRPRRAMAVGLPTALGQWLTGLYYNFAAPGLVIGAYRKACGRPFVVPTLGRYLVFVSEKQQIEEIWAASMKQVSFNSAVVDLLSPKYFFKGFLHDPKDPRGSIPIHALQLQLKAHLPSLLPLLRSEMEQYFEEQLGQLSSTQGWKKLSPHPFAHRMVGKLNSFLLVGEELTRDSEYFEATMRWSKEAVVGGEILRLTPSFLHGVIGYAIMHSSCSVNTVYERIRRLIRDRVEATASAHEKPRDIAQWMINATRKKTQQACDRLAQHTMWLIFASAYQMPMLIAFTLHNLCKHPEYIEPLKKEIGLLNAKGEEPLLPNSMPLMDSFLKETARHQAISILQIPHKVLSTFSFKDGITVPKGNWICVPSQAIMQDEANYTDPKGFNPFRFLNADGTVRSGYEFTTPSSDFWYWGGMRKPCVGRLYVSVLVKMIISHFLMHYDFKLVDQNAPQSFSWDMSIVPHPRAAMLVRKREQAHR